MAEKPRKPTKAAKRPTLGRKGYGLRFLECAWHNLHQLPAEGKNSYERVLCSVIGQTERRNKEKTAPYGEEKSSVYHHDNAHVLESNGQIGLITIRIGCLPTVFSRLGSQRLLSVLKPQAVAPWKEIHIE